MYLLLSSEKTLYEVKTSSLPRPGVATVVTAELHNKIRRNLPPLIVNEQTEYITTAAEAAYSSLNPLDWTQSFHAEIRLIPNNDESVSFDPDSNSAGLGYAIALALQWRRQLNKGDHIDHEVFATGRIHASGSVTSIGHLPTKIIAACNHIESQQREYNQTKQFFIFYPKADQDEVTDELAHRVQELGGQLIPVTRLSQALSELLGDAYDGKDGNWAPFKGLASFNYEDKHRFFGRDRAVEQVFQNYRDSDGLLLVAGVSGSGKSSAIKSKLIPKIEDQLAEGQKLHWYVTSPKVHNDIELILSELFIFLTNAWNLAYSSDALVQKALKQPESLNITGDINKPCLLFIDQYEEVFNNSQITKEQAQNLAPVLELLANNTAGLRVVISIRAEYLEIFGRYGIETYISQKLNPDEWRAIVEKQAAYSGLSYEGDLAEQIINDANDITHALPVVEYLLEQLYVKATAENEHAKLLKQEHYEELGGIKGVIANRAEAAISQAQHLAETFFDYFVGQNSEGISYARSVDLNSIQQEQPELYLCVQLFIDEQLVIDCGSKQQARIKLAHDSLFLEWERLKEWISQHQSYLVWRNRIDGQFSEWQNSQDSGKGNSKEYLIKNKELLLLGKLGLTQGNICQSNLALYVNSSIKAKRKLIVTFSFLFVLVVVSALVGMYLLQESNKEEMAKAIAAGNDKVLLEESNRLLGLAIKENDAGNHDAAMLLALNGMPGIYGGERPMPDSVAELRRALFHNKKLAVLKHGKDEIESAVFSPDDKYIATRAREIITIWDTEEYKKLHQLKHDTFFDIKFKFNRDGNKLISATHQAFFEWSTTDGKLLNKKSHRGEERGIKIEDYSPGMEILIYSNEEDEIIIEKLMEEGGYQSHKLAGEYMAMSSDLTYVLIKKDDKTLVSHSVKDGFGNVLFETTKEIKNACYSGDEYLVIGSGDEFVDIVLYDYYSGKAITKLRGLKTQEKMRGKPAFSKHFNCSVTNGALVNMGLAMSMPVIAVWDIRNKDEILKSGNSKPEYYFGIKGGLELDYMALSNNGKKLLSIFEDGEGAMVWNVESWFGTPLPGNGEDTEWHRLDNGFLLAVSPDNKAIIWDVKANIIISELFFESEFKAGGYSKSANIFVSIHENGLVVKWNLQSGEKLAEYNIEIPIDSFDKTKKGEITGGTLSNDGRYLGITFDTYEMHIIDMFSGSVQRYDHDEYSGLPKFIPDTTIVVNGDFERPKDSKEKVYNGLPSDSPRTVLFRNVGKGVNLYRLSLDRLAKINTFSNNKKYAAIADWNRGLYIWNFDTMSVEHKFMSYVRIGNIEINDFNAVSAFSSNIHMVASAGINLNIWDVNSGDLIHRIDFTGTSLESWPGGKTIFFSDDNGKLYIIIEDKKSVIEIPLNMEKENQLSVAAIQKLPKNRTCLTPDERRKYDLPALTPEQMEERGCYIKSL